MEPMKKRTPGKIDLRMAVVEETDTSAYDLDADTENIILYTCYPFGILTRTTQRYFVYGDLVSGPAVLDPQA